MDEQLEELADCVVTAMHTVGVGKQSQDLLDLAFRFLRDSISLPLMHDQTKLPIQAEAVERATHLADCAMALTPRDHQHARRVLNALIDTCVSLSSRFEVSSDC